MLNETDNNYRQNATGNADSVMLNAYVSNNSKASKLHCVGGDSVLLRTPRFVNTANHTENVWFVMKNIVFAKMMVKGMRGIVKIPSRKVRSFNTVATMLKLAHHFLSTLKIVDLRCETVSRVSTFNPLVAGSNPARPTTHILYKLKPVTHWLFLCALVLQTFSEVSSNSSHCASSFDNWSSVFFN